jgi:hypothetical protein
VKATPRDPAFERALAVEILASEQIRVGVLAATLAVLLAAVELLLLLFLDMVQPFATRPISLASPARDRAVRPL